MVPTIDWSLAPDDATHYDELAEVFCNERGYWCADCYWRADPGQEDWGTSRYIPRPTSTWNGEGLPPAGTVCEVYFPYDTNPEWYRVEVMYSSKYMTVLFGDGEENAYTLERVEALRMKFRPLRTPEQIAAEEREKAILDLIRVTCISHREAARVHDAGYRKVKEADHG